MAIVLNSRNTTHKSHKVGLLLIDGFALMSYASVIEPMRAANLLSKRTLYEIRHLSMDDEAVQSSSGSQFMVDRHLKNIADLDFLIVIAGGDPSLITSEKLFQNLRMFASRGITLVGVSAGPYILANAGVMKDYRMTIHWEHAESLLEKHPDLFVARSLYVMDRNRITCAGGTAPLDMMHALITDHHGAGFARQISDWFMHTEIRPAGGQQKAGLVERYQTNNTAVIEAIEIMENHLADPLTLSQIAGFSGLSPRQMNRLFKAHLGKGTMQLYRELRLHLAHKLCDQSTLSITEIAIAAGFNNISHFNSAFRSFFGKTPSSLRKPA